MGYAVARAMVARGAEVVLVSGPSSRPFPPGLEPIQVESAREMEAAVMARAGDCDLFVAAAAVSDYRVAEPSREKLKKHRDSLTLHLVKNPDILARVAALPDGPFTVGFAAETERLEEHALAKLQGKGLDMIAANRVGGETGGFERDENALIVLWSGGRKVLPLMGKDRLAEALTLLIEERYAARASAQGA
jgi:phosphopantothenoylcysteine decarboxylase/phosphopantothenate--cysteine ligase